MDHSLSLPEIEISEGCRVARTLNDEIKERWNIDAYSLYPLRLPASPTSRFYVVEALQHGAELSPSARWLRLSAADSVWFSDATDLEAIRTWSQMHSTST